MGVKIARESDGHVSITVARSADTVPNTAVLSPVEARLLAIKLLLAAENVTP